MKTNQKQGKNTSRRRQKSSSFLGLLKRFFSIRGNFIFDVFQYLKMENEKLQIIYANIRV
ncbi:hypothetical protein FFWV33_14035 [Flavobacterium faecale]|uniref:Uncharacterized protein n=1 Tax=Flavobacterium faecale TaxID=1355330 RepID=A0A2S1LFN1_9FLAO|nr:hypothetical protein FFWV33_14035 [Flavobacterium faecale]